MCRQHHKHINQLLQHKLQQTSPQTHQPTATAQTTRTCINMSYTNTRLGAFLIKIKIREVGRQEKLFTPGNCYTGDKQPLSRIEAAGALTQGHLIWIKCFLLTKPPSVKLPRQTSKPTHCTMNR